MLASQIFTQKEVGDFYNKNFINLSFDMEKGEGKNIMKAYGVNSFPTLLFLDAKGVVQHKIVGASDGVGLMQDTSINNQLKKIDPKIFEECDVKYQYAVAFTRFLESKTDKVAWDSYIEESKKMFKH